MSERGKRRAAMRVLQQKINQNENREYYQHATEWKSPSTEREITERRKLSK
jgi:uncharacterized protein YijF (DUF1287 family)